MLGEELCLSPMKAASHMQNVIDRFDAVFFDFDGTLADSYEAIAASVNHLRSLRGHEPLSTSEVTRHVGRGPEYLFENTVPGSEFAIDMPRYREHHSTVMVEKTRLLPGAGDVLQRLHGAGKKIALCSNKPRIFSAELLERLGVAQWFHAVIGPEDVPRPKPAPDMVLAAARRVDVAPARVLYVGDMVVDIDTGRAAGVTVWIVPTGSDTLATLTAAKPDRMLNDLNQILATDERG